MTNSRDQASADLGLQQDGDAVSSGQRMGAGSEVLRHPGLVRAVGRPAEVVRFEEVVVGFFMEAAEILGVPRSVAVIYGLCFASAEPLSFADINERLDISQGSISQGLRVLRDAGAIRTVQHAEVAGKAAGFEAKGARDARRREFFVPDLELRKLAAHWLEQRLEKQLRASKCRLRAMKAAVPPSRDGSAKTLKGRLNCLESWHDQSRALVPVIRTFLKLT